MTADPRIASRVALPVPSPHNGSNPSAAVPHASHPGSDRGSAIRGCEGNVPRDGWSSTICPRISRLVANKDSAEPPTERSQPVPSPPGSRNNHPLSRDSIQHVSTSHPGSSRTGDAAAIRDPKWCSTEDGRSGGEATIVHSGSAASGCSLCGNGCRMRSRSSCSETTTAECGSVSGL